MFDYNLTLFILHGNTVLVGLPVYLACRLVGAECGSTIDLSYEIRRPHH